MTLEAILAQEEGDALAFTPAAITTGGTVIQLPDGRAAVVHSYLAANQLGAGQVEGVYKMLKTADIAILDGGRVYWDYSANKAHYKTVNDRDFYVGVAVGDAAAADTFVYVALNVKQRNLVDLALDPFTTAIVGTAATQLLNRRGGGHEIVIAATSEAAKVDMLSVDGFATGANAIIDLAFRVPADGSSTAVDVSMGVANATHATDADAITESIFCHLDENATKINLESDDGTTEVAATDSTYVYVESAAQSARVEVWFDMRDPADVQIYVNGVLSLASTVFGVGVAAGPWLLLVHVEKTSSTDTYTLEIDWLRARIME